MYLCVGVCQLRVQMPTESEEGLKSPSNRVKSDCEPHNIGAGNPFKSSEKSSKCS